MREVLLVFEHGDLKRPIITALMAQPDDPNVSLELVETDPEPSKDIRIDGKRITIEADDEVVIKCGPGSIQLQKDGRIILKGIRILSRAKGVNKIKGGAVRIN